VKLLTLLFANLVLLSAQSLDPAELLKPPTSMWPTYNGDYSGRRYSTLRQINAGNVAQLTMAWAFQTHSDALKSTPLEVNGVLYFTTPDNVWAIDARSGGTVWHYNRPAPGDHVGNRGVAMYKDRLYFGTPDAHLICLNARNGKEVWNVQIADVKLGYYISVAPLLVKDRLIIGTSGDQTDIPHFIAAIDPESGRTIWRWNTLPEPGAAGSETWPDKEALTHGGGPAWMTGTYDPELNLIYWGTGNPHPVLAGVVRRGSNLYTCSILALNPDTGKLVWSFQPSPHDTHDWDAVETPVLFNAEFHGKTRKLLAQASRNGKAPLIGWLRVLIPRQNCSTSTPLTGSCSTIWRSMKTVNRKVIRAAPRLLYGHNLFCLQSTTRLGESGGAEKVRREKAIPES
jgi:alcohol dehydrogenase (cytochrome c)